MTTSFAHLLKKVRTKITGAPRGVYDIPLTDEVLLRLLADAQLRVLDVGARGAPYPQLRILAPFTHIFLCEPEEQEAHRLETSLKSDRTWKDVTVIKHALASVEGVHTLYVTRQGGFSSLLPPNLSVVDQYSYQSKNGNSLRQDWDVVREQQVKALTLDRTARENDMHDLTLIKLDTQGSEFDILKSGETALKTCAAVYCEAEFKEFYKGQPLFSDIDQFLREREFELVELNRTRLRRATQGGIYSRKEPVWAHTLYMKLTHASAEAALRAFAVAFAFHHFDLATELLEHPLLKNIYDETFLNDAVAAVGTRSETVWNSLQDIYSKERAGEVGRMEEKDRDREI